MAAKITFEPNRQYIKYSPTYIKDQDANDGQEAIKSKGDKYLPKLPGQQADKKNGDLLYSIFAETALWYPATGTTTKGYLGIMFRKDPIKKIPKGMEESTEVFSDDGKSIDAFSKNLAKEVILKYRPAVLIDFPNVDTENMSKAQAEQLQLRPYAVMYDSLQIIDWHERIGNGARKLDMVILKEMQDVSRFVYSTDIEPILDKILITDGQYTIIRELILIPTESGDIYIQCVWIRMDDAKKANKESDPDWFLVAKFVPKIKGKPFDYIPIVPCSEEGEQWNLDYSLINDLVNVNIAHYNNEALYRDNLRFLGRPTICFKDYLEPEGKDAHNIAIGSSTIHFFGDAGHSWLLGGDASQASALKEAGNDLKSDMSLIGLRSLAPDTKGVEAAETAGIKRSGEHGTLSSVANAVTATMTKVATIMRDWAGATGEVEYKVQTDFIPTKINPQLLTTLWQMYTAGDLPLAQFIMNLKKGEVLDSEVGEKDFENAKKKVKDTAPVIPSKADGEDDIFNDDE